MEAAHMKAAEELEHEYERKLGGGGGAVGGAAQGQGGRAVPAGGAHLLARDRRPRQ